MVNIRLNKQGFSSLLLWAVFFAFLTVGLGAFTRLMDAGLGCPDWPGCYGRLLAPTSTPAKNLARLTYPESEIVVHKAWIEMVHRYVVGMLSVLALAVIFIVVSLKPYRSLKNIYGVLGLLLCFIYQIVLGQKTVTLKLSPIIVTQHLIGGLLILAIFWLIYLNNRQPFPSNAVSLEQKTRARLLFPYTLIALILLWIQIFLGAWTSTHYASLSCPSFPFCFNEVAWEGIDLGQVFYFLFSLQPKDFSILQQNIQITHRLGALLLTFYFLGWGTLAIFSLSAWQETLRYVYFIFTLLFIQIGLGIINVMFKLPLISALAHTMTAALLLLVLITLLNRLYLAAYTQSVGQL